MSDTDADCELQSVQLNEHRKRTARITTTDAATNKIPVRLTSIKSGVSRCMSLKKGKQQQHSRKRMTNAA